MLGTTSGNCCRLLSLLPPAAYILAPGDRRQVASGAKPVGRNHATRQPPLSDCLPACHPCPALQANVERARGAGPQAPRGPHSHGAGFGRVPGSASPNVAQKTASDRRKPNSRHAGTSGIGGMAAGHGGHRGQLANERREGARCGRNMVVVPDSLQYARQAPHQAASNCSKRTRTHQPGHCGHAQAQSPAAGAAISSASGCVAARRSSCSAAPG